MNLGSPRSPQTKDVATYLNEFLMDGRVIDSPWLLRTLLVRGIIVPFRASKSAEAYGSIWTENGSPLVHITRQVQDLLAKKTDFPVTIAMRYGQPSMAAAYEALLKEAPGLEEVILLPMYPHYAMSSYETAVVQATEVHLKNRYAFKITTIAPFYNDPLYINAMAASVKPHLKKGHHLLFSYHSIPEKHVTKRDVTNSHCLRLGTCCQSASPAHAYCYRHQCFETTRLVTQQLGLGASDFSVSFQSKLGREAWLTPSTTSRMETMPAEGIKKLLVVCPSFVSDCLETLEEINIRERENFMKAGGEEYEYIPCLNTQPEWIETIRMWLQQIDADPQTLTFKPHAAYV